MSQLNIAFLDLKLCCRMAQNDVTQGRVICRLVSMFESVDELIKENDRRQTLQMETDSEPSDEVLQSLEY